MMATVERNRSVALGTSQQSGHHTPSLNSSRGSQNSQNSSEYKSSVSELLSITDAAVKALENTKGTKLTSYDVPSASNSVMEGGIRLLSPREICVVTPQTLDQDLFSPAHSVDGNVSGRLSVGSQSTTASEVLIRATESNLEIPVPNNMNNTSHTSNTSIASRVSSTFLTGQAKAVKVSAKKLKEIQSPFEASKSDNSMAVSDNVSSNTGKLEPNTRKQLHTKQPSDPPTKPMVRNEKVHQTHLSQQTRALEKESDDNFGRHTMGTQSRSLGKDSGGISGRVGMVDSGYQTQSVQVVREMGHPLEHPLEHTEELNSTLRGAPSITEEMYPENITCNDSDSPIDIVAKENIVRPSDDSNDQIEIMTVPGVLHNVSTDRESYQSAEAALTSMRKAPDTQYAPGERFSKFQTSGLKQGMLSDIQTGLDTDRNKDQVHITQYSLNDKQKMLKQALVNRGQGSTAIRKQVTPKVIPRTENEVRQENSAKVSSINDAATTAAVAAASAVAATQPFLKAQQDLEMRITQLMQKIGNPESQISRPAASSNVTDTKQNQKVDELERQLTDLTQRRLDYLEEMQKQQMQWQAQLLSISRDPQTVVPPAGHFSHQKVKVNPSHQPAVHHKPRQNLSSSPKQLSPLDTPAPRRKPPTPAPLDDSRRSEARGDIVDHVTPERKQYKGGAGLLAQILADDERRNQSTFTETPKGSVLHRPEDVSRHAGELVQELGEIKTQMKNVVRDVSHWKHNLQTETGLRAAPQAVQNQPHMTMDPAPLDQYLTKKGGLPTSPYPKVKDLSNPANAPVRSNFTDASEILHKVAISRNYLEANLETITRNRQESDVYSLLQQVAMDQAMPERLRIQKMVDEHIEDMNHSLEREVMEELLKVQENKHSTANFMIPERDTAGVSDKSKVKVMGPKVTGAKVTGVRGRQEARVDTGLRKLKNDARPGVAKAPEKENIPAKKMKKTKGSKVLEKATSRDRVHGRLSRSPQRATQKEPYLRFQSSSPKSKSPKALGRPTEAKGVVMASTRTQAGSGYIAPTELVYPDQHRAAPQRPPVQALPHMVPMAVPLGAPRKEGGLTAPVVFPAQPPPQPLTSTPVDSRQPNVGVLTIKDAMLPEEEAIKEGKKMPKLDIQASEDSAEEEDDTITEDSAPIDLAGYKVPPSTYHGPQFPPQAPPLIGAPPTSHVLATDLKRRDLLQNQALDWVEQELMARVLSEFYANRQEAVPHVSMVAKVTRPPMDTDDTETDVSEISGHDSLIAEGLGQDGLKLFVDAGQPVDDKLVSALLKEVILEKISSAIGSKTSRDDDGGVPVAMETRTTPKPSPRRQKQNIVSQPEVLEIPTSPVVTPKPTPKHTPPPSPIPHQVTPPATPDRTPSPSVASEAAVLAPVISEREDSVKTDSEEERARFMKILQGHSLAPLQPVGEAVTLPDHEVSTPCSTPVASPREDMARTPSPSLRTATPEGAPPPPVQAPAPAVAPPTEEPQPQPWGGPDSPLSEERPPSEAVHDAGVGPEKPITFSVAIQADEEQPAKLVSPPSTSPSPPSPPLRERESSMSSQESPLSSSTVSDTINERISEGQWLLSFKSEGEVPGLQMDNDLRDRIKQRLLEGSRQTRTGDDDDTLLDTDDLEPDQDVSDLPPSEGEFHPSANLFRSTNPVLSMMSQLKAHTGWTVTQPIQPAELSVGVDKSLGEVSLGQRPQMTAHQERALSSQSQGRKGTNMNRRSRGLFEEHKAMGGIHEKDEPETSIDSPDRPGPTIPQPTVSTSTPIRGQGHIGLADKPAAKGQGHPLMATVIPGGREPSQHYRPSTGPGTRSRTMPMSRSLSPDMLSATSKDKLADTRLSQTSLQGNSDLDTQTTDQMNVDALLQSRDYFGNTQSDLGSTAGDPDPGQSEKFQYSINRSQDFGLTQSSQFRSSMGSTSDMSLAPGLTQTLERSEEEVAQENRLSYTGDSDLHDLQAAGRPPGGRRVQDTNGRKEPLQVSVTIPSMGEDSSETQESYDDISELSLGGV